jgi:hypothetical protein
MGFRDGGPPKIRSVTTYIYAYAYTELETIVSLADKESFTVGNDELLEAVKPRHGVLQLGELPGHRQIAK